MRTRWIPALPLALAALGAPGLAPAQEAAPKYMVTWSERPGGSYAAYEEAQERVLALFGGYLYAHLLVRFGECIADGRRGGTGHSGSDDDSRTTCQTPRAPKLQSLHQ